MLVVLFSTYFTTQNSDYKTENLQHRSCRIFTIYLFTWNFIQAQRRFHASFEYKHGIWSWATATRRSRSTWHNKLCAHFRDSFNKNGAPMVRSSFHLGEYGVYSFVDNNYFSSERLFWILWFPNLSNSNFVASFSTIGTYMFAKVFFLRVFYATVKQENSERK